MLALLVDPDKVGDADRRDALIGQIAASQVDLVLVGGSLIFSSVDDVVVALKQGCGKPVVLFPGLSSHFAPSADAILFLSLLSGRNPEFLIGNQVHAAIPIMESGMEVIPTAYILIDGGRTTSVEYMSNTRPIPANKPDIALATAAAAQLLGFRMIYLEAGSGALNHVPKEVVALVKQTISLPVIVGGGIRTEESLREVLDGGADVVVVGTAFEQDAGLIGSFADIVSKWNKVEER
jgi:phosphoglycerol geranylgeranyltransferase